MQIFDRFPLELFHDKLYVYSGPPSAYGKWLLSTVTLSSDGTLKVEGHAEVKRCCTLTVDCVVQAPLDSVWSRIPPLPFKRLPRETFSLHVKKGGAVWFLASSEEERNKWYSAVAKFTNAKPPPYGDYENWRHSQHEGNAGSLRALHVRRSLTPQHRSGFYSVQDPDPVSRKSSVASEHLSGFYSVQESPMRNVFPRAHAGFYAVETPSKKTSDVPILLDEAKQSRRNHKRRCGFCCVGCACILNAFSFCVQQCCMNFASAI